MSTRKAIQPADLDGCYFVAPVLICQFLRAAGIRTLSVGWPRATLDRAVAHNARYSPARDSMLFPPQDEVP